MKVAVVLNTDFHVETLIFAYFSLARIPGVEPVAIPLRGDRRGLKAFLEETRAHYSFLTKDMERHFDIGVFISAYPQGAGLPVIPMDDHPFAQAFAGHRILISHRANAPLSRYPEGHVMTLSPVSSTHQIPNLYPCENPILERDAGPLSPVLRLLVQGKFNHRHRDLELIRALLHRFPSGIHIILLGSGSSQYDLKDSRITSYDNCEELDFYQIASTCHYILPLVNDEIKNGTYISERFSSSLGIAFASMKPSIVHQSLQGIYPFSLGYTYKDQDDFLELVETLIKTPWDYQDARNCMQENREFMRAHNARVFTDALSHASLARRKPLIKHIK